MVILDTNILLRYMLDDIPVLADEAEQIIENNDILIPVEVVAEIVYVLVGVYKTTRSQAAEMISGLLDNQNTHTSDDGLIRYALNCFSENNLDFVDCLMIGYHRINGFDVRTFDKKLMKALTRE